MTGIVAVAQAALGVVVYCLGALVLSTPTPHGSLAAVFLAAVVLSSLGLLAGEAPLAVLAVTCMEVFAGPIGCTVTGGKFLEGLTASAVGAAMTCTLTGAVTVILMFADRLAVGDPQEPFALPADDTDLAPPRTSNRSYVLVEHPDGSAVVGSCTAV